MSELSTGSAEPSPPVVEFAPPDIARRHTATWNGLQTDAVEVVRREPFAYGYRASRHLLIMCERAERDDGETLVEGLPRSTLHEYSHKLSFVPAGHQFSGWQNPRALTRVTYFYIDPKGPLIDPVLHFAETEFKPRLFFFDKDLWETAQKLKEQAKHSDAAHRQYAEALSASSWCTSSCASTTPPSLQSSLFEAALPVGRKKRWRSISTSICSKTFRWRSWPRS
jgi:AraC family transcriptional regulator